MIVKIGLPLPQGIVGLTPAEQCIASLPKNSAIQFVPAIAKGADIWINRNLCVNNGASSAVQQNHFDFDWFLSVDADIVFTMHNIEQLIAHNQPIISGAYPRKNNATKIHAGHWGQIPGSIGPELLSQDTGVHPINWCGGGFILIRRDVFETLEYPWFRIHTIGCTIKGIKYAEQTTADLGFCIHVQQSGYTLLCDCNCKLQHIPLQFLLNYGAPQKGGLS